MSKAERVLSLLEALQDQPSLTGPQRRPKELRASVRALAERLWSA